MIVQYLRSSLYMLLIRLQEGLTACRNAMQAAKPESLLHRSTPSGCRASILNIKANEVNMLPARLTDLTALDTEVAMLPSLSAVLAD